MSIKDPYDWLAVAGMIKVAAVNKSSCITSYFSINKEFS